MQTYIGTSISIGSLKSAALYFDYVIPINLGAEFADCRNFASFSTELASLLRSLRELVPPGFRNDERFASELAHINKETTELMLSAAGNPAMGDKSHDVRASETRSDLYQFIDKFGLGNALLDCRPSLFDGGHDNQSSLTFLVSLNLVNAETVPWEAIMELRKDLEAQERLRRLRVFMYENYDGRSKAFVEDDILTRISEYETEAKRWGLEMSHSTLNTVLGSKVLGGSAVASFFSALVGGPTLAILGGVGVGTLELGRITIEVVRRRTALVDLERRNPVSYISYAKRHLAKAPRRTLKDHGTHRKPW